MQKSTKKRLYSNIGESPIRIIKQRSQAIFLIELSSRLILKTEKLAQIVMVPEIDINLEEEICNVMNLLLMLIKNFYKEYN